jgi:subtilisin family serine protease
VHFQVYSDAGETFVVPSDALALVGRDLVDRRLFDVSALVRFGYDDASRSDVPLIVAGTSAERGDAAATRAEVRVAGASVDAELASVGAVAVSEDKDRATEFWAAVTAGPGPVARAEGTLARALTKIWLDGPVEATLDRSVAQVGAPTAWEAGHTGDGAVVAVLDTGIDATHPDVADAVVAARDFTDSPAGTEDHVGHGTHVASIVTGNGAASGGTFVGVAPDARLLVGKVLDDDGSGSESQLIEGMEWAATQAPVVNMSLGSPFPGDGTGVTDQAVDRLTDETGALFVVTAGNDGPDAQTVTSPGTAAAALTVGAVDDHDGLADFSSRGPRWSRPAIKPDITAPGVDIAAARAAGTDLGDPLDDSYTRLSGTSMAAPHVAGAAAILAGQHPDWEAGQLKAALMGSATPRDGLTVYEQGAGRLDVGRADTQQAYATPASVDAGVARWPHDDDERVATTVTYDNLGTSPLDLDLSLDVSDATGTPAVDGMFTVSPARLTVPPGGSAPATLTIDTTGAGPDGLYGGALTATGESGRVTVRTPIGITKEVESYDVTVEVKDHGGAPTDLYSLRFVDVDQPQAHLPYDPSGTVVARLPAGEYFVNADVSTDHGDRFESTAAIEPTFAVIGDATLVVDAREGRPVGVTVDERDAGTGEAFVSFDRLTAWGDTGITYGLGNFDDLRVRPSDTRAPAGQFTFAVRALLARRDDDGGFVGSPYLYHVRWAQDRKVPGRLVRHVADRGLAVVTSTHAAASASTTGVRDGVVTVPVPGALIERYTPGIPWTSTFSGEEGETVQVDVADRTFRRGGHYEERWNGAVFGPADPSAAPLVQRAQDELLAEVPLFSDQDPNHIGFSATDTGSTTLHRDGELIGESPEPGYGLFRVPAGEGTYRLATSATRSVAELSTRVDVAWTFRSGHADGDGDEPVALPIMGIRFAPRLDDHNRAPSGRRFSFPVEVRRRADAELGTLSSLTVDVSYDDGRTWRRAPLVGSGDERTVDVRHPRGAGYVSLRACATDSAGNRVEQTIIHAYALAG